MKEYTHNEFSFIRGNGEMDLLIKNYDWNSTPLGAPENWPQSLKTTVSILLSSRFPMLLWWGEELIQFYNDAYRPSLGTENKHPRALGQRGEECWPEIWHIIHPMIQQVLKTGKAVWNEDMLVPIYRNGKIEDVYWTFSYSAVTGENGAINGVLVVCNETTEKVNSVARILTSQQQFQNLIREVEIGIIVLTGNDFKIKIVNKFYAQLIDLSIEDLLEKPFFEIIPDIQNEHQDIINKVINTGEPAYFYDKPLEKKSETIYLNLIYQPYSENGKINGIMLLCQDVTEQVLSRRKTQESEQRFRSLIENAPFPIGVYLGEDLIIGFANQAILDIWGRNTNIIGKPYRDALPELKNQKIYEELEKVYKTGIPYEVKNRYVELMVNGRLKPYYMNYNFTPLMGNDGKVYGILSTAANVTDLNIAKRKAEESEAKFRSLIEQAPVATCLFVGQEMKIELANEIMLRYWGKDNAVLGQPLAKALPELKGQSFLEILEDIYHTGVPYESKNSLAKLEHNGTLKEYYFDFTYKPILDASGSVYAIINMATDVTERVRASKKAEEIQQQLLAMFEQSPIGIAILSINKLTFKLANTFYSELVGRLPDELVGQPLLEALPELKGQGFDMLLENVIKTGTAYVANEVAANLQRNGKLETIYVDLAYQPMFNSQGAVSDVLVVATDVTQQVVSRKKVEASELKLRSLIASAPAGIGVFMGRDLIVEMPNQTFIDIVGKGPDIVGKPLREVMPELLTEGQPFLKILDDVFTTGIMFKSYGSQVRIVQNGVMTYNYYNITYTPLFDENNEVYAILDIAIDVTETIHARQRAEEMEVSLRGTVEMAELATWTLHIKENRFSYSERFMEWLGFTEDTKDLDDAYNPLPDDYKDLVKLEIEKTIQPGSSGVYKNEHPIINRITGQERIIQAHAQVFYDSFGNPEVLTGTAQDVTKERKLQQQLEFLVHQRTQELIEANLELEEANSNLKKSNAELAQFAYIASHDLQEPARKVSTFIKMLENNLGEVDERSKNYIDRINNSAERMIILIRDILGYSQLSKEDVSFTQVGLNQVMKEVLSDFELIIEQKQVLIRYSDLPVIEAIPLQISQLFNNLISNSIKYSRKEIRPEITISTSILSNEERLEKGFPEITGKYHKITFSDNGIGFNQEYAEQIFNIFQRLHGKMDYAGTGIGLALCRKIAANHHGGIYASSTEGDGAVFVVILPEKQTMLS